MMSDFVKQTEKLKSDKWLQPIVSLMRHQPWIWLDSYGIWLLTWVTAWEWAEIAESCWETSAMHWIWSWTPILHLNGRYKFIVYFIIDSTFILKQDLCFHLRCSFSLRFHVNCAFGASVLSVVNGEWKKTSFVNFFQRLENRALKIIDFESWPWVTSEVGSMLQTHICVWMCHWRKFIFEIRKLKSGLWDVEFRAKWSWCIVNLKSFWGLHQRGFMLTKSVQGRRRHEDLVPILSLVLVNERNWIHSVSGLKTSSSPPSKEIEHDSFVNLVKLESPLLSLYKAFLELCTLSSSSQSSFQPSL